MKRIILGLIFVMLISITAFAGDIPESYLSDDVQMFFGEVVYNNTTSIQVSPVKKIKGNVNEGSFQTYNNPNAIGDFKIKENYTYLFVYADNGNYIDIFNVTTYDTKTLKLKDVKGDMWDRFEKYMNEGKYGVANIEGQTPSFFKWLALTIWIGICNAIMSPITWVAVIVVGSALFIIIKTLRAKKNKKD